MKFLSIALTAAMILALPFIAQADISLSVSATVSNGSSLGTHSLLECTGYSYNSGGDPWTQCTNKGTATTLAFRGKNSGDPLTNRLYKTDGTDNGGADCFYAANFYIVYLFPDAWGGKGYELKQNAGSFSAAIQNSVTRTPVYSKDDKFVYPGGSSAQGDLTSEESGWNPQITTPSTSALAKDAGLILKAKRARIVRAEYGIPPKPGTGQTRPTTWSAIPLTTTAGTYTGTIVITMTEWQ